MTSSDKYPTSSWLYNSIGTRKDLLVGYSFILSVKNWSNLSETGVITGLFLRGQYRCCQLPPPRPRSAGLHTSEAKLEGWHTMASACARAKVWPCRRSRCNSPFRRGETQSLDKPHLAAQQSLP